MTSKKAEMSFEYVATIILIVVLIIVVLLFIFDDKLLNWVKVLPGYQVPDKDVIKDVEDSDGVDGNVLNLICFGEVKNNVIFIDNKYTGLYFGWFGDSTSGTIKLTKELLGFDFLWRDKEVAKIDNLRISLVNGLDISSFDQDIQIILRELDGSTLDRLNNKLCKNE